MVSKILYLFAFLAGWASTVLAFDPTCNSNEAVYWGQDSVWSESQASSVQQKPLAHYCQDDTYDVILLAFLYIYFGPGNQPVLDLANTCGLGSDATFKGTNLVQCPAVGTDIKTCQSKGKAVILSLGGATGQDGFSSDSQAQGFADTIWNDFLGGSSSTRPFGDAVLDGVDLDIESGDGAHYDAFVKQLRSHFNSGSKKYYLTAAPQCPFPDANIGSVLNDEVFDMLFIQFYNNNCGCQTFGTSAFNFATWDKWLRTQAPSKNTRLYVGAAASKGAADFGYVSAGELASIIDYLQTNFASFGGIMLWDASEAEYNDNYGVEAKQALLEHGTCSSGSAPADGQAAGSTRSVCAVKTAVPPANNQGSSPTSTTTKPTPPAPTRTVCAAQAKRAVIPSPHDWPANHAAAFPIPPSKTGASSLPTPTSRTSFRFARH